MDRFFLFYSHYIRTNKVVWAYKSFNWASFFIFCLHCSVISYLLSRHYIHPLAKSASMHSIKKSQCLLYANIIHIFIYLRSAQEIQKKVFFSIHKTTWKYQGAKWKQFIKMTVNPELFSNPDLKVRYSYELKEAFIND